MKCDLRVFLLIFVLAAFRFASFSQELRWQVEEIWSDKVIAPEGTTGGSFLGELKDTSGVSSYTLGLGADYYYKKFNSGWVEYHDLAAQYQYRFHVDSSRFSRCPSQAEVDYRISELSNRNLLGGIITNVVAGNNLMGSPYDLACMFGIDEEEETAFEWAEKRNRLSGKIRDEEVFSFKLSKRELGENYSSSFELFLRYELFLHPKAILGLMKRKRRVSEMSYWIIASMKRIEYAIDFKELGESKPMFDSKVIFSDSNLGLQVGGATEKWLNTTLSTVVNSKEYPEYESIALQFIADSAYCDAMLTAFEITLSAESQPVSIIKEVVVHQRDDEKLLSLLTSLSIKDTSELAIQEKLSALNKLRLDSSLHRSYVVEIFLANTYEEAGKMAMAEQHFLNALRENPFLAAPYHDLGMLYVRWYSFDLAWKCFDIGLALNPNHPIYEDVWQRSSKIASDYPQFFLR